MGEHGPDVLDEVAAVADAVLFEGYLLYPYRASAQKNRIRWQWGVLAPVGWGIDSGETSAARTELLFEPGSRDGTVHVRVRFLQVQERTLLDLLGRRVDTLEVDGISYLPFEEGLTREVDAVVPIAQLLTGTTVHITVPASHSIEDIRHGDGAVAGRVERTCRRLSGMITLRATEVPGPYDVLRLRIDVRNDAACPARAPRAEALRGALIGTHVLLAADPGSFLSPTDPPEWARQLVAECENTGLWPVLAGPPERSDLVLASPIILGDHPQLAPESTINLFDGLENDEILTLRTMVLTDAEKAQARATDPRAAEIVDAVDALPPEVLERLHGAIRSMGAVGGTLLGAPEPGVPTFTIPTDANPGGLVGADDPAAAPPERVPWWDPAADSSVDPETDSVLVDGIPVARGATVVLRPGPGSDAQDTFLTGMHATVQAVVHDVDGAVHVAVSLGNPQDALEEEMALAHGRFRYFRPDELEVAR